MGFDDMVWKSFEVVGLRRRSVLKMDWFQVVDAQRQQNTIPRWLPRLEPRLKNYDHPNYL